MLLPADGPNGGGDLARQVDVLPALFLHLQKPLGNFRPTDFLSGRESDARHGVIERHVQPHPERVLVRTRDAALLAAVAPEAKQAILGDSG